MKPQTLSIPICGKPTDKRIMQAIDAHIAQISSLVTSNIAQIDPRATLDDEVVRLDGIKKKGPGSYALNYNYDWSAYYGCRDMNRCGTEHGSITFSVTESSLIFVKIFSPFRSTRDEF
jgi:hypothetical protein